MKQKVLEYSLSNNALLLIVSLVALLRQTGAEGAETSGELPAEVLESLKIKLVSPQVTGALNLKADSHFPNWYEIEGNVLKIHLSGLAAGTHRVSIVCVYGTNTRSLLIADVKIPLNAGTQVEEREVEVEAVDTMVDGNDVSRQEFDDLSETVEGLTETVGGLIETVEGLAGVYKVHEDASENKVAQVDAHAVELSGDCQATGLNAVAEGSGTVASGNNAHAEGYSTTASGESAHAEGNESTASGNNAHAEGYSTTASGESAHAEGNESTASSDFAHAEGGATEASGESAHSEGSETAASGDYSHAEGDRTTASGNGSHAEGTVTTASGEASHAEGYHAIASGDYSHAEGSAEIGEVRQLSIHVLSQAERQEIRAITGIEFNYCDMNDNLPDDVPETVYADEECTQKIGEMSVTKYAENSITGDFFNLASGTIQEDGTYYSRREPKANGGSAHVDGSNNTASGEAAHVEGNETTASGNYAHAEGYHAIASGAEAHAEGTGTTASSEAAHAEGTGAIASGRYSHAEGSSTAASGGSAHAEGTSTVASGVAAHAAGNRTIAATKSQTVVGEYNVEDNPNDDHTERGNYAFIVGNGTSNNARSNAFAIDWDGNLVLFNAGTPVVLTPAKLAQLIA